MLCYGPPLVRRFSTRTAAVWLAALGGAVVAASVPIALAAEASPNPRTADLRSQEASLGAQAQTALLELYALETAVAAARSRTAALAARQEELRRRHASARAQLARATQTARVSQLRLAELVRVLYEEGELDPVAILLGSESLDEALTSLDGLDRASQENIRVADQAKAARRLLIRLDARLSARQRELARVAAATGARARELAAAAADRRSAVAALRRERDLTARQVDSLEARARAAQQRTATLHPTRPAPVSKTAAPAATTAAAATSAPAAVEAPAAGGSRQMTVDAVGYSLPGTTASGLPVGHGIVAVDPSVIPLGTRLYVPGYGEAVAADTGGAVHGALIDLWFPTTAAAINWGRRTVVITIR